MWVHNGRDVPDPSSFHSSSVSEASQGPIKPIQVFGVLVAASPGVAPETLRHAASVLAEFLDQVRRDGLGLHEYFGATAPLLRGHCRNSCGLFMFISVWSHAGSLAWIGAAAPRVRR